MSFAQQFQDDLAMGCVCDFDVACPSHPDAMGCGHCEYACHCERHNRFTEDCDAECHALVRGSTGSGQ